ncbi:MAG: preprotein translocase subunit SecY [Patescibacteria group bacterium]|nr:preprotein translocase subunit SecY [Patescibacteria group bacterium]MDE2437826.1 preprotein translocase subunit SecY [Patescibacteria group bacterium]
MEKETFLHVLKSTELRKKILIVLGILVVVRLFASIPIPGVDVLRLKSFLASNQLFGLFNLFSGGSFANFSIAMLGVGPYITATIIMQLLMMVFPAIKEMYYEEGESGRMKFNQYARIATVPLALLQGFGFLRLLQSQQVIPALSPFDLARNLILIIAGTMILTWLGELITEQKVGNGVSLIIFAGIVAGVPQSAWQLVQTYDPRLLPTYIGFVAMGLLVIAGVVFLNEGERKIPVSYAKQVRGSKVYGGVSTYLPLRLIQAGVIPIIFAISVLLFPQFVTQVLAVFHIGWATKAQDIVNAFYANQWFYNTAYFLLVVLFTYFYTAITFDPSEIAKNLQQFGGFIPGIRPGNSTADFITKVMGRITLFGAFGLGLVAILPNIIQAASGINSFRLGGTALLIVVSVAIETMKQVQSQVVMREYEI